MQLIFLYEYFVWQDVALHDQVLLQHINTHSCLYSKVLLTPQYQAQST